MNNTKQVERYAVTWIEADGGETSVREFTDRRRAEALYEKCRTSPERKGRGVAVSINYYDRINGLMEFDRSEFIDAEGMQ